MAGERLPGWANIRVIESRYHRGTGGWEELFDYGEVRYHARLFPNVDGKGIQDNLLLLLAKASEEDDDIMDDYGEECRRLVWPLIERDYTSRTTTEKTDMSPSKPAVKIEGRTVDGKLQAFDHKGKLDYPTHPIKNSFSGIPAYSRALVHRVERLDAEVFKVEYDGQFYCLKTVHSKGGEHGLKREISILQHCRHPNIISLHAIVVNDQNYVEGMLMELIPEAIPLDKLDYSRFTYEQYVLWTSQIQSALDYLHRNSLVWGDAKPANILKHPNNGLVLVDFAGGATQGWVDWKNMDTIDGDMQAFYRIKQFLECKLVDLESINQ